MRLTRVPRYTVTELEQRAEALLRDRCGWPPPIPVDIELLVDLEAGVVLDILPGLQDLCGVAGLVRYEPKQGRMRIVIDADTADHPSASFYRFTVAEEFAHVLLHRDIMTQIRTAEDLIRTWTRLIRKIYEVDPLLCSRCGATMKVVAVIEDEEVPCRILAHLNLLPPGDGSRAPPRSVVSPPSPQPVPIPGS